MSILDSIFGNKEEKHKVNDERSLNSLLREIDRKRYKDEEDVYNRYDDPQTAYDIIANINHLYHDRLNIYTNASGQSYVRTALGFQPVIIYNQSLKIAELQTEINSRDKIIANLKDKYAKLMDALDQEESINSELKEEELTVSLSTHQIMLNPKVVRRIIRNLNNVVDMIATELQTYSELKKSTILYKRLNSSKEDVKAANEQLEYQNKFLRKTLRDSSSRITQVKEYIKQTVL